MNAVDLTANGIKGGWRGLIDAIRHTDVDVTVKPSVVPGAVNTAVGAGRVMPPGGSVSEALGLDAPGARADAPEGQAGGIVSTAPSSVRPDAALGSSPSLGSSDTILNQILQHQGTSQIDIMQVHADRVKYTDALSDAQIERLRDLRNAIPPVDARTPMIKVVPMDVIAKMIDGTYNADVGGFVLRESDVDTGVLLPQIVKDLALDYTPTKGEANAFVAPGSDSYGYLRFTSSSPSNVTTPFDANFGGTHAHDAPFTGSGFLRNPDLVFRPEYYVNGRMGLSPGAELWITVQGVRRPVAILDPIKGFVPK